MKKSLQHITLFLLVIFFSSSLYSQNIGISTTGAVPDASAGLDISFTNKGLLVPRVALTGTNVAGPITTPATSLLVYNTATVGGANAVSPGFYYWDGTQWVRFVTAFTDTDDQTLTYRNDTLYIEDGNFVIIPDEVFDGDSSPTNEIQTLTRSNDTLYLSSGGFVVLPTGSVDTDDQTLLYSNDTLYIADGNYVVLDVFDGDSSATNELQTISKSGNTVTLSNGGGTFLDAVFDGDSSATNELQTLTRSNDTLFLSNGGFVVLDTSDSDWFKAGTTNAPDSISNNIFTQGNVGIGITNPNDRLVVAGGRAEFTSTIDASGIAGTGVIEIGNSLRIDNNEIITNTNTPLYIQQDNGGDLIIDNNSLFVDASTNRVGIGTATPSDVLDVNGDIVLSGGVRNIEVQAGDQNIQIDDSNPTWNGNTYGGVTRFFGDGNLANSKLEAGGLQLERNIQIKGGNPAAGRVLTSDALGNATWQAPAGGDITAVTAGNGLVGGGTAGAVTLTAAADNGLYVNAGADRIRLGGPLLENTTITQANFWMAFNLTGTGDFIVQDNGVSTFLIRDDGVGFYGDDFYWRDGNTGGIDLASLTDDANDGRFRIMENGITSVDLDANTQFIFNEQGLDRNFRVESDGNANMFFVDAGTNRVGIGDGAPVAPLDVNGSIRAGIGGTNPNEYELFIEDTASGIALGHPDFNNANSGVLTFVENVDAYNTLNTYCGFQFRHDGVNNTLYLDEACTGVNNVMSFERGGDVGIGVANPTYLLHLGANDAAKPGTNTWTIASDSRLKEDVNDFKDGLETLRGIRPIYFKYNGKANITDDNYYVGVLAQELEVVAPYMVGSFEHLETKDGDTSMVEYKSVDNGAMTYVAINAIKELDRKQQKLISMNKNISDFGVDTTSQKQVFIPFSEEFKKLLISIPVVTVTPFGGNAKIHIVSISKDGFILESTGDSVLTFNWIAMSKITVEQESMEQVYSEEERKLMLQKVRVGDSLNEKSKNSDDNI